MAYTPPPPPSDPPEDPEALLEAYNTLQAHLARTEQEIGQLSSLLSHDLRARLRSIDCDRDELTDFIGDPMAEDAKEALSRISHAIERVDDLIHLSLLLMREARHRPRLESHPLDVVLRQAHRQHKQRSHQPFSLPEDAPQIVRVDAQRLLATLQILMANAHIHGDGPFSLEARPSSVSGWTCITVWDSGRGIDETDQAVIFEMGTRLSNRPGHGLGLYVARRLMEGWGRGPLLEEGPRCGFTVEVPVG